MQQRKIMLFLLFMWAISSHGQFIQNPSFEGGVVIQNGVAPNWNKCSGTPDIFDTTLHSASNGAFYSVLFFSSSSSHKESIGQELLGIIRKGVEYEFMVDAVNWKSSPFGTQDADSVILNVYLSSDSCRKSQLILSTDTLLPDLSWPTYSSTFIADSNYTHIFLRIVARTTSAIIVDNLKLGLVTSLEENPPFSVELKGKHKCLKVSDNKLVPIKPGRLKVYNQQGREVKDCNGECDLSYLPSGVYLWKYLCAHGVETGKVRIH